MQEIRVPSSGWIYRIEGKESGEVKEYRISRLFKYSNEDLSELAGHIKTINDEFASCIQRFQIQIDSSKPIDSVAYQEAKAIQELNTLLVGLINGILRFRNTQRRLQGALPNSKNGKGQAFLAAAAKVVSEEQLRTIRELMQVEERYPSC